MKIGIGRAVLECAPHPGPHRGGGGERPRYARRQRDPAGARRPHHPGHAPQRRRRDRLVFRVDQEPSPTCASAARASASRSRATRASSGPSSPSPASSSTRPSSPDCASTSRQQSRRPPRALRERRGRPARGCHWAPRRRAFRPSWRQPRHEARDQGIAFETVTMPFGHIARAIEVDEPAGIMKVLVDPAIERSLEATIVGAEVAS